MSGETIDNGSKTRVYVRYPLTNVLVYEGSTVIHYLLGGAGILLGYGSWTGYLLGSLYLLFAFGQMYVAMPLKVCPNCIYHRMSNSLCVSGLNVISKRMAKAGDLKDFSNRARGLFCENNLYLAALIIPVILIIPALVLNFSFLLVALLLAVVVMLLFRFFVVFPIIACTHCSARRMCPNAKAMGLS